MRRRTDAVCALVAAAAVVVLTDPKPNTDYVGIGLALLAAACWGCYVLLNATIGQRLTGLQGSAAAAAVSGVVYLPVGALVLWQHPPSLTTLCFALAAGALSSAVPFLSDMLALRRVPAHFFGIFMSVNPVFAALVGLVVLDQHLARSAWLAIGVIVGANVVAATRASRPAAAAEPSPPRPRPAVARRHTS